MSTSLTQAAFDLGQFLSTFYFPPAGLGPMLAKETVVNSVGKNTKKIKPTAEILL